MFPFHKAHHRKIHLFGISLGVTFVFFAGILASLVSQGMEPFDAAVCAAYLHGAAADRCVQRLSEYYMQPDDILKDLGELLKEHIR